MDAQKMIAEIKMTCSALERRREELTAKIKIVDDKLTGYRMAIDALELTVSGETVQDAPVAKRKVKIPPKGSVSKFSAKSIVEINGKKQSLNDWATECGLTYAGLYYRLRNGWSLEDALSTGKQPGKTKKKKSAKKVFVYDARNNVIGQHMTVLAAAKDLHLPEATVKSILDNVSKEDQLRSHNYYIAYA